MLVAIIKWIGHLPDKRFIKTSLLSLMTLFFSCTSPVNEKDEIFFAGGASGGIGGIYFALYKNNKYEVCETGGIGKTCYYGNFKLSDDTITLLNLSKDCYIKNNRLLICRYKDQDSTYWQWKYPRNAKQWSVMKRRDLDLSNVGDVHQLNNQNRVVLDPTYYFIIRLDSLKNYR